MKRQDYSSPFSGNSDEDEDDLNMHGFPTESIMRDTQTPENHAYEYHQHNESPQERYFNRMNRLERNRMPNLNPFLNEEDQHVNIQQPTRTYSPDISRSVSPNRSFHFSASVNSLSRSPSPTKRLLGNYNDPFGSKYNFNELNPFNETIHDIPNLDETYLELRNVQQNNSLRKTLNFKSSINQNSENPYNERMEDRLFGGYQFDEDDTDEQSIENFEPFPVLDNTYYPINLPRDVYNPFEVNFDEYKDDLSEAEETNDNTDLIRQDTLYRNAKAIDDTVMEYTEPIEFIQYDDDFNNNNNNNNNTSAKQVRMVNGNLVLDCPVSEILLNKIKIPLTDRDREFLFMRFQACTALPDEFEMKKFSLRQKFYTKPRETELMIVVTMYNEDEVLLARTLKGIFKNIKYLYGLKHSSTWGKNSWQKVVVTIISDGRQKINPKSKALLAALGVYQEGFAKNKINNDDVIAHIYEYTTMVGISKINDGKVTLTTENQIPIQLVFCLKEQNQRKINSHKWALKAFAPVLNPNVIILLDVGTQPENKSLYRLWKSFKDDHRVAGSCGEIKASLGKNWRLLLNPLVAAQNYEYKISNILDKPMESVFGFITVLPGAFSAYRYKALIGEPMEKYLKGEDLRKNNDDGIFNANMYLAEDRILCFELIAKLNEKWILKYISTAGAYTDVPEQLDDFISQRRRWLNGSFFAAVYSIFNFYKIWWTNHSIFRKIALQIEFFYQFLNLLVSWFSLGSYFLVFRILTVYLAESDVNFPPGNILSVFFLWLYLASLTTTFVLSFGNKPKGTKTFYLVIVVFFAVLMAYMIFATIFMSIKSITDIIDENSQHFNWKSVFVESKFRNIIISIVSTYVLYLVGFIIFLQPQHMLTCSIQYLLLSPSYVNVLNIYAFCNIHDISWGTKGQDKMTDLGVAKKRGTREDELEIVIPTTKRQIDEGYSKMMQALTTTIEQDLNINNSEEEMTFYYAFFRSMTVLLWMFTNFIIVALVTNSGGLYQVIPGGLDADTILPTKQIYIFLSIILYLVAFMALFRFVGCSFYLIERGINAIRR
ncbi:chitin synthase [Martiniozyma asiatica (nom. inval.)]|nr:chitin synthase [Martiniozyma asiatica]